MWKSSLAAMTATVALAQSAPVQAQLPPGVFAGEHDYRAASPGEYPLDPGHTAVIAKVSHIGYGLSVFRFDKVEGVLRWNPAQPGADALKVSVQTASISTPVPGFAEELSGDRFLKSGAYPTATFVSTAFRQIDAAHGQVSGQFTLMGQTRPLTFNVELMGAGKGFMGHPRIGVEAKAMINPQEYGITPMLSAPIQLVIDAEFAKAP